MASVKPAHNAEPLGASPYEDLESQQQVCAGCVYDCDSAIKKGFLRKVYGLLTCQLLVTVGMASLCMFQPSVQAAVTSTRVPFYIALFSTLGFIFALHHYKDKHPHNLYLLGGFTLAESYLVGVICALYQAGGAGMIVLEAFLLTFSIFLVLTAIVFVTKKDFSFLGGGLFAVLMVMCFWSFLSIFVDFGPVTHMIFSLVGACLFTGYILYDTSVIMHNLGPDDYILASVTLYLDLINLFLYLLEILRGFQGGSD